MPRHLLLQLVAPLAAFGGETIDSHGVTRAFPALSMLTGLFANALGWRREQADLHADLQRRLVCGARLDRPGIALRDYQTALLFEDDRGWTTRGRPEGRAKSPSYTPGPDGRRSLTQQRWRDYHADSTVLVALRLSPADTPPTLDHLAAALDRPARPLFIGRKPCLPRTRLVAGWIDAADVLGALLAAPALPGAAPGPRLQWPDGEGNLPNDRRLDLCDERDWLTGVHGGWRPVREGAWRAPASAGADTGPTAADAAPTPSAPTAPKQYRLDLGEPHP